MPNERLQINLDFSITHINSVLDRGQPGLLNSNDLNATPASLSVTQPGDYLHETDIATTVALSYKITKNLSFNTGFLNYITRQNVAEHGLQDYETIDLINLYYSTWNYPTTTYTTNNYFTLLTETGKVKHQVLAGYDYVQSKVDLNQQYYELPGPFNEGSGTVGVLSLTYPKYMKRPVGQYRLSDYDNDETDVDDDVYHTQGIYLQDQLSFDRWKILLGVRGEFYRSDDGLAENVFLPRVGIVYALQPNINWYATYNKGFDPFEASSATQVFDQPFKPLTSQLWETGVKANLFDKRLLASIAVYQLTVQNVAVNDNDISNPNLFVQQGENRSQGIELEAAGNILPNLSVMLSYAYCVAKVTKSDVASEVGSVVENAPRNSGSGWAKYTFRNSGIKGFGLSAGYTLASKRNTLDPDVTLPGYVVFNGGLHYTHRQFTLALNLNNITNKTYWTGAYNNVYKWPGAPRDYMLNLAFQL